MNGLNYHDHYRDFEVQREQLLRRARQEHAMREATRRSPRTPSAYRTALVHLLVSLFRS